jgi:hypothetical protein
VGIKMKIGDKLVCDNGHTYTIEQGNLFYPYSIVDEFGEAVNRVTEGYLEECIDFDSEYQRYLCVENDIDGNLKYTRILMSKGRYFKY